jgi:1,4-alpha-glucan branching enzyme
MIKKQASPIPGHVRVVFELPSCTWADKIFLSGDFNEWRSGDIPLRQDRNGVWRAVLDLPIGTSYQFRYLIDGEWRTDFHADGCTDNLFGSQNSLLIAELAEAETIAHRTTGLVHDRQLTRARAAHTVRYRPMPSKPLERTP